MNEDVQDLVFRKACDLLKPFNVNNIEVSRGTDIAADLEIDSVAVLDMIMAMEDTYDVSFPMNLISEIRTVGELVDAIHRLVREKAAP